MKDIFSSLSTNFIFLRYLRSALLFFVLTLGLLIFFLSGSLVDDVGSIPLFNVGNTQIPVMVLDSMLSTYLFATGVILIFMITGLSDVMLNGQLVHIIIARNQNRLIHISSFLLTILIFLLLVNSVFFVAGLKLGLSPGSSLVFFFSKTLIYLFIALVLVLLLNFEPTKRNATLILIVLLFVVPFLLEFVTRFVSFGFADTAIRYAVSFTKSVLTTHSSLANVSEKILLQNNIIWSTFFKGLMTTIILWVSISIFFVRKEFHK